MGANTVSNHNLAVVTKGTPHNATTKGATDRCKVPPVPTVTPFVNYVPSSQLGPGQTTKTFIAKNPIVTKRAIISPPSKDPHPGVLGGVTSGTYLMEASMVGASPDVFAEGSPVCRSTDATKQNHANTDGSWIEGDVKAYLARQLENQKKRCTVVKVEGHCAHKGRQLAFPPGESQAGKDGYYLEVLSVDEVTLKATRKSAIPGETEPDCMFPGEHTKWVIKRTGPAESPMEKTLVGDDQVLGRDVLAMLLDETLLGVTPKYKTQSDKINPANNDFSKDDVKAEKDAFGQRVRGAGDETRTTARNAGNEAYGSRPLSSDEQSVKDRTANGSRIPAYRQAGADRMAETRAADATKASDKVFKDANTANKAADRKYAEAVNLGVNFAKLALLWYAKRNPVVVQIEASACSGAKNAKLIVLPTGKAKFDLYSDKLQQVFSNIKAVGEIIQKIGKWCGINAQVKFLEKPGVSITIEYKELTEDKNKHVKSEANRAWDFAFGFDPFLSVKIEVAVPIPTFLAPMGALLARILKYFGAEGVVFVSAEVAINPTGSITINEYDEFGGYLKATVKITLELGVRIRWGDTAEIWASAYVETTIDFPSWRMSAIFIPEIKAVGKVQLGFKGGAWADIWGWRKSVDFNYKPPNWSWNLGEVWLPCLLVP
jgi:hypothetical protein